VTWPKSTFALNSWTVELRIAGRFYGDTYRDLRSQLRGPKSSTMSVTLIIARGDDEGNPLASATSTGDPSG
jgi:hypothetical protein